MAKITNIEETAKVLYALAHGTDFYTGSTEQDIVNIGKGLKYLNGMLTIPTHESGWDALAECLELITTSK